MEKLSIVNSNQLDEMKMRKYLNLLLLILLSNLLISCVSTSSKVQYHANIANVENPVATIRRIIEEQPPSYGWLPSELEVTERAIKMTTAAGGSFLTLGIPVPGAENKIQMYFKHMGEPVLHKLEDGKYWGVQMVDKHGTDLYWAYTETQEEAKSLINSLSFMIKKNRK